MNLNTKLYLEYSFGNSSTASLWNYISTASGLSQWFADEVENVKGGNWTFKWDGSAQEAHVAVSRVSNSVKVRWLDFPANYFFEIKIVKDELTGIVSLVVNDLIEEDEVDDQTLLWNTQMEQLMRCMGIQVQ